MNKHKAEMYMMPQNIFYMGQKKFLLTGIYRWGSTLLSSQLTQSQRNTRKTSYFIQYIDQVGKREWRCLSLV